MSVERSELAVEYTSGVFATLEGDPGDGLDERCGTTKRVYIAMLDILGPVRNGGTGIVITVLARRGSEVREASRP